MADSVASLRDQIQTAQQDLLQENEQNLAKFLEKLACFCANEKSALEMSSALRNVRVLDKCSHGLQPYDFNGLGNSAAMKDCNGTPCSKHLTNTEISAALLTALSPGPAIDGDDQLHATDMSDELLRCSSQKNMSRMDIDLDIQILPFIAADGTLRQAHPPTAFSRLCGCINGFFRCAGLHKLYCRPNRGRLANVVRSNVFKLTSALVIVLNFLFIIVQSDWQIDHLNEELTPVFKIGSYGFTAFYTVELVLLMVAEGGDFWIGHDVVWNIFDFGIVAVAYFEIFFEMVGGEAVNTSFLRILRFFKISRVFRMFSAIRMFKEIRIMVDSMVGCFSIFLFCSLTLMVFLCIFAIFFVQGMTSYFKHEPDLDPRRMAELRKGFGSVGVAMFTLFKSATGGDDWSYFYEMVEELGTGHSMLFLLFMAIYVLAFFNVITATFCEKAISLATPTIGELIQERIDKEFADAKEITDLMNKYIVDDGSRALSADTFERFINNAEVQVYFETRGMKSFSAQKFFQTLCQIEQSDTVSFAQFISAAVKMDGVSSALDTHCNAVKQTQFHRHMTALLKRDRSEVKDLCRSIHEQIKKNDALLAYVNSSQARSSFLLRELAQQVHEVSGKPKIAL